MNESNGMWINLLCKYMHEWSIEPDGITCNTAKEAN